MHDVSSVCVNGITNENVSPIPKPRNPNAVTARNNFYLQKIMFPRDIKLDECRVAIQGVPGWREIRDYDYIVFAYDFTVSGTFPDPNEAATPEEARMRAVRRECRGLVFSQATEKVISRRFHKFFNVNEVEETDQGRIDLTRPHILLKKEDGCLVAPFLSEGRVRWATKTGITEICTYLESDFLPHTNIDYYGFAEYWIKRDWTCIFEWCSNIHIIVLPHEKDDLILTAMRNNTTGEYMPHSELVKHAKTYGIPDVAIIPPNDPLLKIDHMNQLCLEVHKCDEPIEGFVIRFDSGEMYKLKTRSYVSGQRLLAPIPPKSSVTWDDAENAECEHEKDIWALILDNQLDDWVSLEGDKGRRITEFSEVLWTYIVEKAKELSLFVEQFKGKSKDNLLEAVHLSENSSPALEKVCLAIYEGKDSFFALSKEIRDSVGTPNFDEVRTSLVGGLRFYCLCKLLRKKKY